VEVGEICLVHEIQRRYQVLVGGAMVQGGKNYS